jgi:hypothetical protein
VANLVKALIRAGRFLAPIVVFAEAANHYRLIAGGNRLVGMEALLQRAAADSGHHRPTR